MTESLSREIRFRQLFTIGFGTMIGVGWLIAAGSWILGAGPGGAILAFAIGGLMVLVVGLCYGELGAAFPYSGGEVVYVHEALGPFMAFFTGWVLTLIYIAFCAFEAVAAAWIVSVLLPDFSAPVLYEVAGSSVSMLDLMVVLGGILILTWINVRGGKSSASFQDLTTWAFIAASALFVLAGIFGGQAENRAPLFQPSESGSYAAAVLAVLATVPLWYSGFNTLPQALGEITSTSSLRSFATILSATILAGFIFYSGVILATASALPREDMLAAELPVAEALFRSFESEWPGRLVLIAGLLGIITSWNATFFCGARVLFSLGRARIIPQQFGSVDSEHGSPAFAVVFVGLIAGAAGLLGRGILEPIINLAGFCFTVGYIITAVTLIRLRIAQPELERPYRMPYYPVLPVLSVLVAAMFSVLAGLNIFVVRAPDFPIEFIVLGIWLSLGFVVWWIASPVRRSTTNEERSQLMLLR